MRSSSVPTRATGLGQQPSIFEGALDRLAEAVDSVAPGARGRLVHEFMMRNGYFENPDRADALFQEVPEIDAYMDQIKISRATEDVNRGLTGEQVVATVIGFGLGLGVAYFVSTTTSSSKPQRKIASGR